MYQISVYGCEHYENGVLLATVKVPAKFDGAVGIRRCPK
jgi:hypothetical protein